VLPMLFQTFSGVRTVPEFLVQLENVGLLDAVLPFILIFAIVFTVIHKTKMLHAAKGIHVLIALVMSLLVVVPHVLGTYPPGQDVVNIINGALPNVSLVIVIIIAALLVLGIFKPEREEAPFGGFLSILSVIAIIYIFGLSAGWWKTLGMLSFLSSPDIQALVVIILVFALVIFLITADKPFDDTVNAFKKIGWLKNNP